MPAVIDEHGRVLQAHFLIDALGSTTLVYVESRGGSASRETWNRDYNTGLEIILGRLGSIDATLVDAQLASRSTAELPSEVRRLRLPSMYPLRLADVDPKSLRLALGRAQGRIGRAPGAMGPGNRTRRIVLYVDHHVPSPELERILERGSDDPDSDAAGVMEAALGERHQLGYAEDYDLRRAIEKRAMDVTQAALEGDGWSVRDVSARESYDFSCVRGSQALHVEVKGTRGRGEQVLLTKNEVVHARTCSEVALAIVREIAISNGDGLVCTGGELDLVHPWRIEAGELVALAFAWRKA